MTIKQIAKEIEKAGGRSFLVGGCVRDQFLGSNSKDIDVEVFGVDKDILIAILEKFGKVNLVGVSFGIIKLTTATDDFDFSLPRIDNKIGTGHRGFIPRFDPNMTIEQASRRRDFTINALSVDILTDELIDNFNGMQDLADKILRHISEKFGQDPVRVLRGMQFSARFDFEVSNDTAQLCKQLKSEFHTIAKERIWMEFEKLFSKSIKPSRGIDFLIKTGWIEFFPEIENMIGVEQEPTWHPEGDVMEHTKHVMNAAAKIAIRENLNKTDRTVLVLSALCHDMGKPDTTEFIDGAIRSRNHADVGVPIAERFMKRIGVPKSLHNRVMEMTKEHMIHTNPTITKRTVTRLIARSRDMKIDDLMMIIESDHSGRPPLVGGLPSNAQIIKDFADEIGDRVDPILMGRHLIDAGMQPGVEFGQILKAAFEAQMNGEFDSVDGAIKWMEENDALF